MMKTATAVILAALPALANPPTDTAPLSGTPQIPAGAAEAPADLSGKAPTPKPPIAPPAGSPSSPSAAQAPQPAPQSTNPTAQAPQEQTPQEPSPEARTPQGAPPAAQAQPPTPQTNGQANQATPPDTPSGDRAAPPPESPVLQASVAEASDAPTSPELSSTAAQTPGTTDQARPAPTASPQQTAVTGDLTAAYRGIVKIEVAIRMPDYSRPWMTGRYGTGNGTGFMVDKGLFMTNAHVVANAERIYLSPYTDARKIPARVKFVAHDCDLALVEIDDTSAFEGVPCLQFSDNLPRLEDTVRAIGYPIGGSRLSVTRGIVSRIDAIPYSHPRNEMHMAVQIDAAVNPGNSGGPILMGNKVVGVAFQGLTNANATGYMIPTPVIKRFLKDVSDGRYDEYVDLGASFFPLENEALRRHYGLPQTPVGVVVGEVLQGSSADGVLQVGDVVLAVDGLPVDSSAMIILEGQRVQLEELAERAFKGDQVTFSILRQGEPMTVTATLHSLPGKDINLYAYDRQPRYVQFAGLIFQPLNLNVALTHKLDMKNFLVELDKFIHRGGAVVKDDLVIITDILKDEVNARLGQVTNNLVTKVNGVEVKGLRHLYELLYPEDPDARPPYTVIELSGKGRPIVIDNATVESANARISGNYGVNAPARL